MNLADAYRLFQDGAVALSTVERNGIRIDVEYCREKIAWIDGQIVRAERRLKRTELYAAWSRRYGVKLSYGSAQQLRSVLGADFGVRSLKQTEGGEDSADEESLRQSGVEGVDELLRMRKLKKSKDVLGGFLRYQVDGFLYPSYLLHTVQTYRSSSSEPNVQNVAARDKEAMDIQRRAIVPSPGHQILEIDMGGVEVSIATCYHKDPTMMEYLRNPAADMHTDMARELFFLRGVNAELKQLEGFSSTLRQAAKNGFVFPEFYGDYFESCAVNMACGWLKLPQTRDWREDDGAVFDGRPIARHLMGKGIEALSDFTEHVRGVEKAFWYKRFPVYRRWRETWYERYQRTGTFEMKTGFRISGVLGRNQAVNYPVQGAAFHCLLWTLIELVKRTRGWRSRAIGEIHDSNLIDAHPDEVPALVELVTRLTSEELPKAWNWIIVPMRVEAKVSEIDGSWAEMRVVH